MVTVDTSALGGRLAHRQADPWRWSDARTAPAGSPVAGGTAWLTVAAPEQFATFGGIAAVLEPLVEAASARSPALVAEHGAGLDAVLPERSGRGSRRGLEAGADAITFAIVRRISRESLHTSTIVDAVARFLLACLRAEGPPASLVVVTGAERMDRPSLRVLYRLWALAGPADGLAVHVHAAHPAPAAPGAADRPFAERLLTARAALLDRLQRLTAGDPVPLPAGEPLGGPPPGDHDVDAALTESAHGLVNQNYESAYLWAWAAARRAGSALHRSQLWRMTALADANLGQYGAARTALRTAAVDADDPRYRAHLHYLDGLLSTKRFYELDEADAAFDRGLAALDGAPVGDGATGDGAAARAGVRRAALERAWLVNGKALVATLRARGIADAEQRRQLLDGVLRTELDALGLVAGASGPDEVYLRFNLLANIAFLLEIGGRFPEAVRFWERAFGQLLEPADHEPFEQTFAYRVGLLQAKAGDLDAGVSSLERALELALRRADRFSAERIAGGLAYALLLRDGHGAAVAAYERAAALALDNADPHNAADHLGAVLACRVEHGDGAGAGAIVAYLQGLDIEHAAVVAVTGLDVADPWDGLVTAVREARLAVRPPPPKLPAYVPLIDLEPVPDEDLNRYLAGAGASNAPVAAGALRQEQRRG